MTDSTDLVDLRRDDDGVAVLTLSHGKVNSLSNAVLTRLGERVAELAEQPARAVVITGGPKIFAAGADITEFTANPDPDAFALAPSAQVQRIGRGFLDALNAVAALDCPTIAAVNGVALGGGCELAMACDFRVAAEDARLGQPEILLGIIPGGGGTQRLTRLVGPARAKDLVFSGRTVTAEEAERIGLVDRVVAAESVLESATEWARSFARGPRHALALAKRAIDDGLAVDLDAGLLIEQERFVQSFTTPDGVVGVRSFLSEGPGKAVFD